MHTQDESGNITDITTEDKQYSDTETLEHSSSSSESPLQIKEPKTIEKRQKRKPQFNVNLTESNEEESLLQLPKQDEEVEEDASSYYTMKERKPKVFKQTTSETKTIKLKQNQKKPEPSKISKVNLIMM